MLRKKGKPITLQEHMKRVAPLGGKASMERRTPEQRREFAELGGAIGGKARAEKLSKQRRREIARKAAAARWAKGTQEG